MTSPALYLFNDDKWGTRPHDPPANLPCACTPFESGSSWTELESECPRPLLRSCCVCVCVRVCVRVCVCVCGASASCPLIAPPASDEYHSAPACEDKVEHAHSVIQIGKLNNAPAQYNGRGGRGRQIGIPQAAADNAKNVQTHIEKKDDESIWHFTWEVEEHEKPHGWFLIAADCALEQYNAKVSRMDFEVNTHRAPLLSAPQTCGCAMPCHRMRMPPGIRCLGAGQVFRLVLMTGFALRMTGEPAERRRLAPARR